MLIIKVNKLLSFLSSRCFLKEIENMYSVFVSSYRNTRESLGELEKAVETLTCGSCSHSISPNFHLCFYNSVASSYNSVETRYMFSIFKQRLMEDGSNAVLCSLDGTKRIGVEQQLCFC